MPFPQQVIWKTLLNDNTNDIEIEQNLVLCVTFLTSETSSAFDNDDGSGGCDWHSSWWVLWLVYHLEC